MIVIVKEKWSIGWRSEGNPLSADTKISVYEILEVFLQELLFTAALLA